MYLCLRALMRYYNVMRTWLVSVETGRRGLNSARRASIRTNNI